MMPCALFFKKPSKRHFNAHWPTVQATVQWLPGKHQEDADF